MDKRCRNIDFCFFYGFVYYIGTLAAVFMPAMKSRPSVHVEFSLVVTGTFAPPQYRIINLILPFTRIWTQEVSAFFKCP
jgi:hypothetical protein